MSAIEHRRRLRERMESQNPNLASFRATPAAPDVPPEPQPSPSPVTDQGAVETGTDPGGEGPATPEIAAKLPTITEYPATDEGFSAYIADVVEALMGMEQAEYNEALLYLQEDERTYAAVYKALTEDQGDAGGEQEPVTQQSEASEPVSDPVNPVNVAAEESTGEPGSEAATPQD